MPNRFSFLLLLCLLTSSGINAQKHPGFIPARTEDTPPWAREMYRDKPDVWRVDSLYEAFYRLHPFQQTTHTQYYKKWRRFVEPHLDGEGFFRRPAPAQRMRNHKRQLAKHSSRQTKNLLSQWECLGPFETRSTGEDQTEVSWQANVYTIDQSLSHPDILYCGTEAGGVFKTENKGLDWTLVSANTTLGTVTAVKVHPGDPQVVYAGTGNGMYKTTDGGQQWTLLAGFGSGSVNDIAVSPGDPLLVLAATSTGFRRSADGGLTWSSLFTDAVYDLEFKPDDPATVYLLKDNPAQQRCEFFKSTDHGQSFQLKDQGWYASADPNRANYGARMTVTDADPDRVYAILIGQAKTGDNGFIGVYRSDDAGESWNLPNPPAGGPYTTGHPNLATINPNGEGFHQGYYNLSIAASDDDPDRVLIGTLSLWKTEDGGQTFTPLGGYQGNLPWIHPDVQEIEINGADIWVATDGGIDYSGDFFATKSSRKKGITASDYWGFDSGWNEDVLVGGRYHNGNTGFYETYPAGEFLRLGGAEAPTGYVNPGANRRVYFSDIGGRVLPDTYEGAVGAFTVGLFPTESYFSLHSSEMTFDPRYYQHLYLGNGNKLWKSIDGGRSFSAVHAFGAESWRVLKIEVTRSNPDVLFVTVDPGFGINGYLYRSTNGGETWTPLAIPPGGSRRMQISVSPSNEDHFWIGYRNGADGAKVFQTTDGGQSWTNLSTTTLDGERIHDLLHAGGTDGGVYLGTDQAVYYRNNSMPDWLLYSNGLPLATSTNILRPFYRDGKLRLGAYGRGIWQVDLHDPFSPVAQPMVDKAAAFCTRDTFYFEDYSILRHEGATWSWSFPGAAYVSDPQVRNPKVVYPVPGVYDVTLTVTQGGAADTRTIPGMVTVTNGCDPDDKPGLALDLGGQPDDLAAGDPLLLNNNKMTFSAWIKPEGAQNPWAGIFFCRGGTTTAGLNFGEGQELRYHWNGAEWWWNSGLEAPPGQWSHVALVIEPNRATIYLNGVPAHHQAVHPPEAFDADFLLGADPHSGPRRFHGLIDEVCLYNRALTTAEIREQMHLTRTPADTEGLIAYYQFNRADGPATDRSGIRHLALAGATTRTTSTAPVGPGVSYRLPSAVAGNNEFPETGLALHFPSPAPNGEWVITRLNRYPDQLPAAGSAFSSYWILHHFGVGSEFNEPGLLRFSNAGTIRRFDQFQLYQRPPTADGSSWSTDSAPATQVITGMNGAIHFGAGNGIQSAAQLVVARGQKEWPSTGSFEVELTASQSVLVSWTEPDAQRLRGFWIERRSETDTAFNPLAFVPAGPHTHYRHLDEAPVRGLTRYRLRRVFSDDLSEYSVEKQIRLQQLPEPLILFPNPVSENQQLQLRTKLLGPYEVYLFNVSNKISRKFSATGDSTFDISALTPGLYSYVVVFPQHRFQGKLIILPQNK